MIFSHKCLTANTKKSHLQKICSSRKISSLAVSAFRKRSLGRALRVRSFSCYPVYNYIAFSIFTLKEKNTSTGC